VRIGDRELTGPPLLVAEIGNNHEGDAGVARELVEAAAAAGADAVKTQVFRTEGIVRRRDAARFAQLERFRLGDEVHEELAALARSRGLLFVATPLDLDSAAFLEPLVDALKIASGDNDFLPLLDRVAAAGKPVLFSTGLSEMGDVRATKARLEAGGLESDAIAVLHCVTAYPIAVERANLAAIGALAEELGCVVGYSDHTIGIETAVAAAALGARVVEKHFTLRHDFSEFRDHQLSADPAQLARLAEALRAVPGMLGEPVKRVLDEERALLAPVRRSIAAARDLPAGHVVSLGDLTWLRPRDGLEPGREGELVGRTLARDVGGGESILLEDLA
jgi:N,N'-diacetyllegionaminate synthase